MNQDEPPQNSSKIFNWAFLASKPIVENFGPRLSKMFSGFKSRWMMFLPQSLDRITQPGGRRKSKFKEPRLFETGNVLKVLVPTPDFFCFVRWDPNNYWTSDWLSSNCSKFSAGALWMWAKAAAVWQLTVSTNKNQEIKITKVFLKKLSTKGKKWEQKMSKKKWKSRWSPRFKPWRATTGSFNPPWLGVPFLQAVELGLLIWELSSLSRAVWPNGTFHPGPNCEIGSPSWSLMFFS